MNVLHTAKEERPIYTKSELIYWQKDYLKLGLVIGLAIGIIAGYILGSVG